MNTRHSPTLGHMFEMPQPVKAPTFELETLVAMAAVLAVLIVGAAAMLVLS